VKSSTVATSKNCQQLAALGTKMSQAMQAASGKGGTDLTAEAKGFQAMADADLTLVVVDASQAPTPEDEALRARAERQGRPDWEAVSVPSQIDRIDVAGGTLAGWSALSTMIAAPLLAAGGGRARSPWRTLRRRRPGRRPRLRPGPP